MNDMSNRPMPGQDPGRGGQPTHPTNQPRFPIDQSQETKPSSRLGRWTDLTPDQKRAYCEGTRQRSSRKKSRPSLVKHRDLIIDCVKGKAVMRVLFDDLCAMDPAVLDDFGAKGHRKFNAAARRLAGQ